MVCLYRHHLLPINEINAVQGRNLKHPNNFVGHCIQQLYDIILALVATHHGVSRSLCLLTDTPAMAQNQILTAHLAVRDASDKLWKSA